ncbi:MAG: winged helix-turn-helix transcriptional regulator [Myxococcales bacterium]|nr:winged helix-turn-helix transcriptional regulator [Myxococcales bacterium]
MSAELNRAFFALSDPTRRAIVRMLAQEDLQPSEIAEALKTTRPTMSRHLKVLREAGLIEEEGRPEDARGRVYRLQRGAVVEVRGWLEEVEAFWADQLDAFKVHAERTVRRRRP